MFHSIRSTPLAPATVSLLAPHIAANDSVTTAVNAATPAPEFRCGRTGTRNRDIWSALPDIRSARDARRLQHWAKSSVLFVAAAVVFALALASFLMH
ncbi:hypothetical protein [Xanthomonas hortorum]|uniref:Uncharacterized protein n=1 Tax=Xanthomonas hortorum pv. carotae TaxID=487904 RepID=A0A6V7FJQ3_9XANT|nr:hypothetical protein XHC_4044 [Xanthomonas hortorum pv. carotae str. M081]CAD0363800.1 hypothetical protein CFBP7900_40290 [Xanthomonas hortorum pv. carotae]CAD0363801.1 hypothetical protein CFBP7900_40290 [Xanthomonas hortorum pv. carotae]